MKTLILCSFLLLSLQTVAFDQIPFFQRDHRILVYRGDTIAILADSAFVISTAQANLINDRLLALQSAEKMNASLINRNATLLTKVDELEKRLEKLLRRVKNKHQLINADLALLLNDLDESIVFLQASNEALALTNQELKSKLKQMDQTIIHLKKINRRIGWQNTRDKIAIGLLAFGLGVLVGL